MCFLITACKQKKKEQIVSNLSKENNSQQIHVIQEAIVKKHLFTLSSDEMEGRKVGTKGIEKANSWAVDGHKTLNTPYDCGIIMCEDDEAIKSAKVTVV